MSQNVHIIVCSFCAQQLSGFADKPTIKCTNCGKFNHLRKPDCDGRGPQEEWDDQDTPTLGWEIF